MRQRIPELLHSVLTPLLACTAGAAAAALAANDKAHTMRQLGVGTPANHIIGLLCGDGHEGRVKAEHEEMDYEEEEEEEEEAEAE